MDTDLSGTLEYEEVAKLGTELGIQMSHKDLKKSFEDMDKNGDGMVTRCEQTDTRR
jgi:Ca2+-binding EF-hand superfamily protein